MNERQKRLMAPVVQRGVYLSIADGNDGVTVAIIDAERQMLQRGIIPGHLHMSGGPSRVYFGFITDEAWPEIEAVLRRFGRVK